MALNRLIAHRLIVQFSMVLCYALASLCTISVASAQTVSAVAPVVNGNTILVEPDGWYQFQRADDFSEVCAGTYECAVAPGRYIVINHTTQQRWEPVVVSEVQSSEPQVVGNRIVLADDGWYQVQDGQTYASICEGVAFCDVSSGSYIVINHTSGQRFESINVGGGETLALQNLAAQRYSDSAGEIFWQRVESAVAITYEIYRDGIQIGETTGTSFFDDGLALDTEYLYEVVALETGARADVTLVGNSAPQELPIELPLLSAGNAQDILKQVVSVINEDRIDNLFEKAQADLKFQGRRFFLTNTTDEIMFSQGIELLEPYQLETDYGTGEFTDVPVGGEYVCASGGTIENYGSDRVFNGCVVGEHTYGGTIGRRLDQIRGTISRYPFYGFSVIDAVYEVAILSGGFYTGNTSFVSLNQTQGWNDAEFLEITADGIFLLSNFTIQRADRAFTERSGATLEDGSRVDIVGENRNASIEGSFEFMASQFEGALSVNDSLSFTDSSREPTDPAVTDIPGGIRIPKEFQWESGSIEVMAQDGSRFTVIPSDPTENAFTIELSNGETIGPIAWAGDYIVDCGAEQICPTE